MAVEVGALHRRWTSSTCFLAGEVGCTESEKVQIFREIISELGNTGFKGLRSIKQEPVRVLLRKKLQYSTLLFFLLLINKCFVCLYFYEHQPKPQRIHGNIRPRKATRSRIHQMFRHRIIDESLQLYWRPQYSLTADIELAYVSDKKSTKM